MKSINQHYRDLKINSIIEKILFYSLFVIPLIITTYIYIWLSPISFFERFVALIFFPIIYCVVFYIYFTITTIIQDSYDTNFRM